MERSGSSEDRPEDAGQQVREVGGGLSGVAGIGALIAGQLMEEQLAGAGHDFGGGPCRVVAGAFQPGPAVLLAEVLAGLSVLPAGAGIGGEPGDGVAGAVRPCGASSAELPEALKGCPRKAFPCRCRFNSAPLPLEKLDLQMRFQLAHMPGHGHPRHVKLFGQLFGRLGKAHVSCGRCKGQYRLC